MRRYALLIFAGLLLIMAIVFQLRLGSSVPFPESARDLVAIGFDDEKTALLNATRSDATALLSEARQVERRLGDESVANRRASQISSWVGLLLTLAVSIASAWLGLKQDSSSETGPSSNGTGPKIIATAAAIAAAASGLSSKFKANADEYLGATDRIYEAYRDVDDIMSDEKAIKGQRLDALRQLQKILDEVA